MALSSPPPRRLWIAAVAAGLVLARGVEAQRSGPPDVAPPDAPARSAVLDTVLARLDRQYVFEDVAQEMARAVRIRRRALVEIEAPGAFADSLTAVLQRVSGDRHLGVYHDPARYLALTRPPAPAAEEAGEEAADDEETDDADARDRNYGFRRVEVLDGNVGYVELTRMESVTEAAGARAVAAMALVAGAEAVVIDLRENPGGSGRMNQLLSSYFFDGDEDRWLVSNVNRSEGTERQEWMQPYVPGRRMPDVPLYLLVSPQTGSAAEGLAYNLQALGRAVVVGEPTYGAAHSGGFVPLLGGLVMFVPSGRTVNPVTGSNWEGRGVQPDVRVEADRALAAALADVWERRLSEAVPGSPEADRARWALDFERAQASPVAVDASLRQAYVGLYEGDRRVEAFGDALLYGRAGQQPHRLIPLADDVFALDRAEPYGPGSYRLVFERDADGRVTGVRLQIRHAPTQVAEFEYARVP